MTGSKIVRPGHVHFRLRGRCICREVYSVLLSISGGGMGVFLGRFILTRQNFPLRRSSTSKDRRYTGPPGPLFRTDPKNGGTCPVFVGTHHSSNATILE